MFIEVCSLCYQRPIDP